MTYAESIKLGCKLYIVSSICECTCGMEMV